MIFNTCASTIISRRMRKNEKLVKVITQTTLIVGEYESHELCKRMFINVFFETRDTVRSRIENYTRPKEKFYIN